MGVMLEICGKMILKMGLSPSIIIGGGGLKKTAGSLVQLRGREVQEGEGAAQLRHRQSQ